MRIKISLGSKSWSYSRWCHKKYRIYNGWKYSNQRLLWCWVKRRNVYFWWKYIAFGGQSWTKKTGEFELFVDFLVNLNNFKISKVIGCGLKRIGDLSEDFWNGACGTYNFPDQRIMLCFGLDNRNKCQRYSFRIWSIWNEPYHMGHIKLRAHSVKLRGLLTSYFSFDGTYFRPHANSLHGHYMTSLATIEGSPFGIGGHMSDTNKAEIYNISTNRWNEVVNYPYHS